MESKKTKQKNIYNQEERIILFEVLNGSCIIEDIGMISDVDIIVYEDNWVNIKSKDNDFVIINRERVLLIGNLEIKGSKKNEE